MNPASKRAAFFTLGCKVNQYDTEAMQELFRQRGYRIVGFEEPAEVYVINTCTVTQAGDRKSRQIIRRAHRTSPHGVIAVTGCYAQRAADAVLRLPGVSVALGTQHRHKIVDYVERAAHTGVSINGVEDIMEVRTFEETPITAYEGKTRAVLKIQEGCSQFCAYCIIPYARGPVRSRDPQQVRQEVVRLAAAGYPEVVLTGIHIASYGKDLAQRDLLSLLQDIHETEGLIRIRLGSVEPTLLTDAFVQGIQALPKVCPHFHVSLQSGCDATLRRMNRKYTTQEYRTILERLRSHLTDAAVTTDMMTGFPGETEDEFEQTLAFVREMAFSKIHVFSYSPREGTPAARFPDQVPAPVKEMRSQRLSKLASVLEAAYQSRFLGRTETVLFEGEWDGCSGWLEGHTAHYIPVAAPGPPSLEGRFGKVLLERVENGRMLGRIKEEF